MGRNTMVEEEGMAEGIRLVQAGEGALLLEVMGGEARLAWMAVWVPVAAATVIRAGQARPTLCRAQMDGSSTGPQRLASPTTIT